LRLNALRHEGCGFAGDAEQDTAVARSASGCPSPLEAEGEILIGLIGEEITERSALADKNAILDGPDILFFHPLPYKDVGPAAEVTAIEELDKGRGGRGLGGGSRDRMAENGAENESKSGGGAGWEFHGVG
jgi:hypothetical protein